MEEKCEYVKNLIGEYVDRTLELQQAEMVREHVCHCSSCSREYEELSRLKELVKSCVLEEEVPPGLIISTWDKIKKEAEPECSVFDFLFVNRRLASSLSVFALGLMIVIIGFFSSVGQYSQSLAGTDTNRIVMCREGHEMKPVQLSMHVDF
jgi:predicted anti-sigma-YlaC factor YlaD